MNILSICICCIICVTYILHSRGSKQGLLFQPGFIISLVFLVMQIASSMRLYQLIACSDKVYLLCLVAVVAFVLGTLLANKTTTNYHYGSEYRINYRLVYIALVISVIIMVPYSINMISQLRRMGLDALIEFRRSATSHEGILFEGTSSLSFFLYDLIVQPLCFAMPAILGVDFVMGRKDSRLFIGTIVLVAFKTLFTFNRATLLYALIIFLYIYKINQLSFNFSRKQKTIIVFISVIVVSAVYYITTARAIMPLEKSIYKYTAGTLPNLDQRLDAIDRSGLVTFGFASMRGVFNKIWSILNSIDFTGVFDYPNWYLQLGDLLNVESPIPIGDGLRMNAFVTPIYAMYIDGREFGVLLGMLIYGYLAQKTYIRAKYYHNVRHDSIYALVMLGLLFSIVRMQFSNNAYAFGLICIYFFTKRYPMRSE